MRFLFTGVTFLVSDILLLFYLVNSDFFRPETVSGDVDSWNIGVFIVLVVSGLGFLVAILTYLTEKLLYCGRKEFPAPRRAIRFGVIFTLVSGVLLFLHIFHILNLFVALLLLALIVIGIMIVR